MINILLFLGWGVAIFIVGVLIFSMIDTFIVKWFKKKKVEVRPQTIYAGTEDNVEFFEQIADAFGIEETLYVIDMVDGEYEIKVKKS